jgi:hypothetical protein
MTQSKEAVTNDTSHEPSACPVRFVSRGLPAYDPSLLGGGSTVPYIVAWTGEQRPNLPLIYHPRRGISYSDEILLDRDEHGILWDRMASQPGIGRPIYDELHPIRQRRAMRQMLCQVCAKPASHTEQGVLWLLPDHREDWTGWPEGMGNTFPPLCVACARISVRQCPVLRPGHTAIRARQFPIAGVSGGRYAYGHPLPQLVERVVVPYGDSTIRWVRASQLVRTLHGCTFVDLANEGQ